MATLDARRQLEVFFFPFFLIPGYKIILQIVFALQEVGSSTLTRDEPNHSKVGVKRREGPSERDAIVGVTRSRWQHLRF